MNPLRIVVVGVGRMGRRHAEKVAALGACGGPVTLAGVVDLDLQRAHRVAAESGTRAAAAARELFPHADAAVVAVPTVDHFQVVREALDAGLDVLVEKPVAATLEQGEHLLELARRRGRVLQVGHQEWFNAALRVMRRRIEAPLFIEAHRMGPFPDRANDVDVVRDLMIHDLDILQQLLGEEPERIDAVGLRVVTEQVDVASARLVFPGGCVANVTASRVSPSPLRQLRCFQRDGYLSIDFLAPSASILRRRVGRAPLLELEELKIEPEDALLVQLRSFVDAVGAGAPRSVSGLGVLGALRTALRVVEAMPEPGLRAAGDPGERTRARGRP